MDILDYNIVIDSVQPTFLPLYIDLDHTPTPIRQNSPKPTKKPTIETAKENEKKCDDLPDNARPCKCFKYFDICSAVNGCFWNINTAKCDDKSSQIKTSKSPTNQPTTTIMNDDKLCCNAKSSKNNGICKIIDDIDKCKKKKKQNTLICRWDKNNCLLQPCIGKKGRCNENDDCCSGICVRFRGI
eukprot:266079_1